MLLVAASWTAFVELTPAHSRPYVGSSKDNTELNLTFGYNGFGRIEGEYGGPGGVKNVSDGTPQHRRARPPRSAGATRSSSKRSTCAT